MKIKNETNKKFKKNSAVIWQIISKDALVEKQ